MSTVRKVQVTQEIIDLAVRRSSTHCMISDAVTAAIPDARNVLSDTQSIRYSNPKTGKRYVYLTPRKAMEALIAFDYGQAPEPFTLVLRNPQIVPIRRGRSSNIKRTVKVDRHTGEVKVEGGKTPPMAHLADKPVKRKGVMGTKRAFGLRRLSRDFIESVDPTQR